MNAKSGFQRNFFIFVNEDAGYEAGQKPSGHLKLEVREGRGRLHALVQNLRPGNNRLDYKLYLLRTGRERVIPVCVGQLVPKSGKAELEWSFEPRNVGVSGYAIEEFDIAAVLVEYAESQGNTIVCPLAAYKNKKTEWRSGVRAALQKKVGVEFAQPAIDTYPRTDQVADMGQNGSLPYMDAGINRYDNSAADGAVPIALENIYDNNDKDALQFEEATQCSDTYEEKTDTACDYSENKAVSYVEEEEVQPQQMEMERPSLESYLQQAQMQMPSQMSPQPQTTQEQYQPQTTQEQYQPQTTQEQYQPQTTQEQPDAQYPDDLGQIDTGCVYLNGNICGAFVNNGTSATNPCDTCRMHHGQTHLATPPTGDISRLKEELNRYFEESDPFHSKRSDYMWWKVNNPVNLNNLLYQCNIRSPLLFNPVVMMAHYKYRHLIIGIFQHKAMQKQYVVCGVPGMHMVDRKPFGEMSRWVQVEGNRPRYGAFGYWLVYINPDDGKILNMSQE